MERSGQQLAGQGRPIGPDGLLIAAQALMVATVNVDEFCRVPGWGLENGLSE